MKTKLTLLLLLSTLLCAESVEVSQNIIITEITKEYETLGYKNPEIVCTDIMEESFNNDEPIKKKRNSNYVAIGTGSGKILMSTQNDEFEQEKLRIIDGKDGAALARDLRNNRGIHPTSNQRVHREKCSSSIDKRQEKVRIFYRNHFYINGVKFYKDADKPLEEVEVTVTYKW